MSDMADHKKRTALIIGAGAGGLATAARLAKAGFEVTLVEKNDFAGGRCSLLHDGKHRFDQGPSLLLLPDLFREAFTDLDTTLEDEGVHLLKCEPNYNVWFGDGEKMEMSSDLARMKREVEKWEGKDGFERYLGFLAESHRHYELSVTHVLKRNYTSLLDMARPDFVRRLFALHPFTSVYARASKYFWTDRLRRVFTFSSMYMGMSPFEAPGTYSLLQYTELAEGIWYPKGGFNMVMQGLMGVGERLGVKMKFDASVAQIIVKDNRACGIRMESGEEMFADVVVCNADLVYAYNNLLPASSYARALSAKKASCSSISFYWSMDQVIPELEAHNIFLADDFQSSFDDIFKRQSLPAQPSFYVNVPSRVDPTAAPAGQDSIVVLVPVGHLYDKATGNGLSGAQDWEAMIAKARNTILTTVKERTGADLAPHITNEIINDPRAWKTAFNLDKGAILGLSHSFFNVLSFRPKTKHASIDKLFFVGASTHPGTGVPICLAGAKITSEQILDEFGIAKPWATKKTISKTGGERELDRVRGGNVSGIGLGLLLALLAVVLAVLFGGMGQG